MSGPVPMVLSEADVAFGVVTAWKVDGHIVGFAPGATRDHWLCSCDALLPPCDHIARCQAVRMNYHNPEAR